MKTTKLTADRLLNFLSTALEVLADEADSVVESNRLMAASEGIAAIVDEYPDELEAALELAVGNGLVPPERVDEAKPAPACPRRGSTRLEGRPGGCTCLNCGWDAPCRD